MAEVKRSRGSQTPKDGRRERGEASVQRIIDATIELIADEGLARVTMQRIAEHVNGSTALVVFHFGSKENLFRAVLQYLSDQYHALWTTLVHAPGLSAVQRLKAAVECAQIFGRQHPKWVSVFVVFASDRRSMQLYHEIGLPGDLAYNAEATELVAQIAREGGYSDIDPRALGEGLNYLVHGAWFWDHLYAPERETDVLRKTVLMLLHQAFPRHFDLA
ncbi:TetR/AcrR family transcriptional regulator [Rhizobium sp. KVB221]|uniref:TetR/AcrR family transcriptional regulator n=1 Tax=Rhizobium setariae TaxID=2801340 RepID=A0A936YWQ5_9HYPH|nr:TetR/AcrR family transcriptional regulator [Rhizobium setariae]MBL0375342.1 TetR/AcrR family transcriptional regulator [Rhizobium setariae]